MGLIRLMGWLNGTYKTDKANKADEPNMTRHTSKGIPSPLPSGGRGWVFGY